MCMSDYKGAPPHDHIGMGEEFIEHHGVMGMKWGVRRYHPYPKGHSGGKEVGEAKQPRTARQLKRALNKNDLKISTAKYDTYELSKRKAQVEKSYNKSKSERAKERKMNTMKKLDSQIADKNAKIKEGNRVANNLLKEARKNGYTINSKQTMRTVHKGEIAAQMLIAAPVLALTPVPMAVITTKSASGTKYKVSANKRR